MRYLTLLLLLFCVFLPVSEARPAHFGPYYRNVKHSKQKKFKRRNYGHRSRKSSKKFRH